MPEDAAIPPSDKISPAITFGVSEIPPYVLQLAKDLHPGWQVTYARSEWTWIVHRNNNDRRILYEFSYKWVGPAEEPVPIPRFYTRRIKQGGFPKEYGRIWAVYTGSYDRLGFAYIHYKPSIAFVETLIEQRKRIKKYDAQNRPIVHSTGQPLCDDR